MACSAAPLSNETLLPRSVTGVCPSSPAWIHIKRRGAAMNQREHRGILSKSREALTCVLLGCPHS
jgi:hypothetical protein